MALFRVSTHGINGLERPPSLSFKSSSFRQLAIALPLFVLFRNFFWFMVVNIGVNLSLKLLLDSSKETCTATRLSSQAIGEAATLNMSGKR